MNEKYPSRERNFADVWAHLLDFSNAGQRWNKRSWCEPTLSTEGRTYAKIKAPLSVKGNGHGLFIPWYGVSCDHLQQDKILRHCLPS